MGGGGTVALSSLARVTMPLGHGGVCFNLTTRNTGYSFKYQTGTRLQKYPEVRALSNGTFTILCVVYCFCLHCDFFVTF